AERPEVLGNPAFFLEEKYSGESIASKLGRLREEMKKLSAEVHLVASLDDVCYLLNTRGQDAGEFRVAVSYLLVSEKRAIAYFKKGVLDAILVTEYAKAGVEVKEYEEIYQDMGRPHIMLESDETADLRKAPDQPITLLIDSRSVNSELYSRIPYGTVILDAPNPSGLMKAVKNPVERENIREAHLKDAVAMVEFLYWLKHTIGTEPMTEWTASEYVDQARSRQEGFLGLSFETISAYNANAAMMHYSADEQSAAELAPSGMLLVDSGGHYLEGTTDITRTVALGEVPEAWKKAFTLTLKGNLQLARARFLYGATGPMLDVLAREPLWQEGIDYKCGTGHGVGYVLSVHEGPNAFRPKATVFEKRTWVREENEDAHRTASILTPWSPNTDPCVLKEGMVTTDEPGVYMEGEFGIRIENELLCRKDILNESGQFMSFEQLTFVPIDLELIDPAYLDPRDIRDLNDYHREVYEKVAPRLSDPRIKEWLREVTRPL
ncbi:MAG: aminopeptidase P family protein, partial [Lachnospiraceae bacterium]|nr:aminopeptidase P family protein [Lachnospiraceae bacterium]